MWVELGYLQSAMLGGGTDKIRYQYINTSLKQGNRSCSPHSGLSHAPRFPPRNSLSSPPPSPRRRRRELRESDDTEGNIPIEAYLLRADPYRSTTLLSPLPHPIQIRAPNEALAVRLQEELLSIERAVSEYFARFTVTLHSVTKSGYPGGDRVMQLLLICVVDENSRGKYGRVKDRVRSILGISDLSLLNCEVVDLQRCFQPSLFPLSPSNPAIRPYQRAEEELLQTLRNDLGSHWRMMSLFDVGMSEDVAVPTLVVMVSPTTVSDWSGLRDKLLTSLRAAGAMAIEIEFIPGGCSKCTPPELPGTSFRERIAADGHPQMDSSVGVKGKMGGCTLGGFIELVRGEPVHNGFLTSSHVVQPSANVTAPSTLRLIERHGHSYFDPPDGPSATEVFFFGEERRRRKRPRDTGSHCPRPERT